MRRTRRAQGSDAACPSWLRPPDCRGDPPRRGADFPRSNRRAIRLPPPKGKNRTRSRGAHPPRGLRVPPRGWTTGQTGRTSLGYGASRGPVPHPTPAVSAVAPSADRTRSIYNELTGARVAFGDQALDPPFENFLYECCSAVTRGSSRPARKLISAPPP